MCMDDIALVSDSMDAMEEVLRVLDASCLGMGLTISSEKTKILAVHPYISSSTAPVPIQLGTDGEHIEVVEDFEYLGSTITPSCSLDWEIDRRVCKAAQAFCSLYGVIWCRRRLKVLTKLHLFQTVVLATLL